jgi:hypothetical protein
MAAMKWSLDLVVKAAAAAVFVLCVECFAWQGRRRDRVKEPAVSKRARLRVRRQADAGRVTFSVEGALDEFAARMLACSVAQVPPSATTIIDLSAAEPIRGGALAIFARVFAAGRRVRLRGLGRRHDGLLVLRPARGRTDEDPQPAGFAELRSIAA